MEIDFNKLPTTILGAVGERYISEFAASKSSNAYIPAVLQSNPVDSICVHNSGKLWALELKTKPRRLYHADSGMDLNDFNTYLNFQVPVYLLFCDHITKTMYGQWAKKLEPHKKIEGKIVYFNLEYFDEYRKLKYDEVVELINLSTSNYWK